MFNAQTLSPEFLFTMINPSIYHASKAQGLSTIIPNWHSNADNPVVYGTFDPVFSLSMTYGTDDDISCGYFHDEDEVTFYIEENRPNAFNLYKNPASIYELDSDGFLSTEYTQNFEFVKETECRVIKEWKIPNVLGMLKQVSLYNNANKKLRLIKFRT